MSTVTGTPARRGHGDRRVVEDGRGSSASSPAQAADRAVALRLLENALNPVHRFVLLGYTG
jgi:hypothetical protein